MHTISLKNRIAAALIGVLCAVLIISSVIGLRRLTSRSRNYDSTADGLTYLRELSARDLSSIDATLAAQKKAHESAERAQRMKELTDGTVDIWSYFTDYVMFGDSRAVGFSYFGFLSESRVIADSGWTIRDLEANLDNIVAMNPSSVYLAFGLNDVGMGYWATPDEYAAEFKTVLDTIRERLPNASVYVNSILPTTDEAAAEHDDAWKSIPEYSAAVETACYQSGCVFINNDELVAQHTDMFDEDGIHMVRDFYPLWAANMMLTIYGSGTPLTASDGTGTEEGEGDAAEDAAASEEGSGAEDAATAADAAAEEEPVTEDPAAVDAAAEDTAAVAADAAAEDTAAADAAAETYTDEYGYETETY